MTDLVGHLLLFGVFIVGFLLVAMLIGRLVRPKLPTPEKEAIYECGEPTIGTSYVQFDLRFYVVALLFIIFDVEVAFFFPWAMVFGEAMQLADARLAESPAAQAEVSAKLLNATRAQPLPPENIVAPETARLLGVTGLVDILVFFGVLLVGFAYVWYRGDLDWVRAVTKQSKVRPQTTPAKAEQPERVGA
jgi:NADH-quinone oxidoreductase subunit A